MEMQIKDNENKKKVMGKVAIIKAKSGVNFVSDRHSSIQYGDLDIKQADLILDFAVFLVFVLKTCFWRFLFVIFWFFTPKPPHRPIELVELHLIKKMPGL